jgi:hypothetical protein
MCGTEHVSLFCCSFWDGLASVQVDTVVCSERGMVLLVSMILLLGRPVLCLVKLDWAAPACPGCGHLCWTVGTSRGTMTHFCCRM